MAHFVYILSNPRRTTLYINATNDLERTLARHKTGRESLFTQKYKLVHMIYMEMLPDREFAEQRLRQLRNWRRAWKWNLILASNPSLRELTCLESELSLSNEPLNLELNSQSTGFRR